MAYVSPKFWSAPVSTSTPLQYRSSATLATPVPEVWLFRAKIAKDCAFVTVLMVSAPVGVARFNRMSWAAVAEPAVQMDESPPPSTSSSVVVWAFVVSQLPPASVAVAFGRTSCVPASALSTSGGKGGFCHTCGQPEKIQPMDSTNIKMNCGIFLNARCIYRSISGSKISLQPQEYIQTEIRPAASRRGFSDIPSNLPAC